MSRLLWLTFLALSAICSIHMASASTTVATTAADAVNTTVPEMVNTTVPEMVNTTVGYTTAQDAVNTTVPEMVNTTVPEWVNTTVGYENATQANNSDSIDPSETVQESYSDDMNETWSDEASYSDDMNETWSIEASASMNESYSYDMNGTESIQASASMNESYYDEMNETWSIEASASMNESYYDDMNETWSIEASETESYSDDVEETESVEGSEDESYSDDMDETESIEASETESYSDDMDETESLEGSETESYSDDMDETESLEASETESYSDDMDETESVEASETESYSDDVEETESIEASDVESYSDEMDETESIEASEVESYSDDMDETESIEASDVESYSDDMDETESIDASEVESYSDDMDETESIDASEVESDSDDMNATEAIEPSEVESYSQDMDETESMEQSEADSAVDQVESSTADIDPSATVIVDEGSSSAVDDVTTEAPTTEAPTTQASTTPATTDPTGQTSYVGKFVFTNVDPSTSLDDTSTADYIALKTDVEDKMLESLQNINSKVVDVVVLDMSLGSLVVDARIYFNSESVEGGDVTGDLIKTLVEFSQATVTIDGQESTSTVTYDDATIEADTDQCALLELVSPCDGVEECEMVDGVATCRVPVPDENGQKTLYNYGDAAGDSYFTEAYPYGSEKIQFKSKMPFGSLGFTECYVLLPGVLSFGNERWAWYPSFESAAGSGKNLFAVFWTWMTTYESQMVFYHLYEQDDDNTDADTQAVLDRATEEISTNYEGAEHFEATTVLVATWDKVKPWVWYSWICKYSDQLVGDYYTATYDQYCKASSDAEVNTFQAVYASDGETAYVIRRYKDGEMKWRYDPDRIIQTGYTNTDGTKDYETAGSQITVSLDTLQGSHEEPGMYIDYVGKIVSPDAACKKYHSENIKWAKDNATYQALIDGLYNCPCTRSRLGRQWWYMSGEQISESPTAYIFCYALSPVAKARLERLHGNYLNKKCCFEVTYPESNDWNDWYEAWKNAPYITSGEHAGRVMARDPWYWLRSARDFVTQDQIPHQQCCIDAEADLCYLFYQILPKQECSTVAEFVTGRALGDPHILTLDGKGYTMNGWGEYILVRGETDTLDFTLQGRTGIIVSNGTTINATIFIGFAAKEDDTHFQVTLNSTGTGMDLMAGGNDITTAFYSTEVFEESYDDSGVTVTKTVSDSRIEANAAFGSSITLSVWLGLGNIEFKLTVPKEFEGDLKGMMGNFNGDQSDDFITPDGTQLSVNMTERELLNDFGKKWQATSGNTIFIYPDGETALDYRHDDFEPIFGDEVDAETKQNAIDLCGSETAVTCIFDFIATKDETFAQNTNAVNAEADSENADLANALPTLSVNQSLLTNGRWIVDSEQASTLQLSGEDADGHDLHYMTLGDTKGQVAISAEGLVTFTPDSDVPVLLNFQVNDTKGGVSAIINVPVTVCPTCNTPAGTCDTTFTRQTPLNNTGFLIFGCKCQNAWSGDECDVDIDYCADNPCLTGQSCDDIAASTQGNSEEGFICGPCPSGYEENLDLCVDIDECTENTPCTNSACQNTPGNYTCTCNEGYSVDADDRDTCNDIDECSQRLASCAQECINTLGGYNCSCNDGYELNEDGETCKEADNIPDECAGCAGYCVVKETLFDSCACNSGYKVNPADDKQCINVDECTEGAKPCSQECTDTEGSYNCSCFDGYQIGSDGIACEECPKNYYGAKCASICKCNGRGSCNNVKGCVCNDRWSGTECTVDVNECDDEPCPVGEVCVNTQGSHECNCASGYERDGEDCVDVDECLSVLTHDCDLAVENCKNTQGEYDCPCRTGFKRNTAGDCEDINECDVGTHNCQQVCENVVGFYNCKCRWGYALQDNREDCVQLEDHCMTMASLNCSDICIVDRVEETARCDCNTGYYLLTDEQTCADINECNQDSTNLCSDKTTCVNLAGKFECSCPSGSLLENDERTCAACTGGKWGDGCANDCACINGDCDPKEGCKCHTGYTGTHCDQDINECEAGTKLCTGSTICVNTLGSAKCDCKEGFVKKDETTCEDIDECDEGTDTCSQTCNNSPGSYSCSCFDGYTLNDEVCEDINECDLGLDGCQQNCVNRAGGFDCRCDDGYKIDVDGSSCIPSEECITEDCAQICARIDGVDTCSCRQGYTLNDDDQACDDVDLCATAPCADQCMETNDNTSFACSCSTGKKLDADGYSCSDCVEGTFGDECAQECTCSAATTINCDKVTGSCNCTEGYTGDTCSDNIDECTTDTPCTSVANSKCIDTTGSYVCQCLPGYKKDGDDCIECAEGFWGVECLNQCDCDTTHSTCAKSDGTCNCFAGWEGDRCDEDSNECDEVSNNCTAANRDNWDCVNLPGTYKCECAEGYVDTDDVCENFDECLADHTNECDQTCTDASPSYTCACTDGYSLNTTDGHQCHDVNECDTNNGGCEMDCDNAEGTFSCSCNSGFTLEDDGRSCIKTESFDAKLTFDIDVSDVTFDPAHASYISLKAEVQTTLKTSMMAADPTVVDVIVNELTQGSLIVDVTTIFDSTSGTGTTGNMIASLILLSQTNITIDGKTAAPVITYNNTQIDENTDQCQLLEQVTPCAVDSPCVIVNNVAQCKGPDSDDDDEDLALIIGLSIGIPLLVIVLVLIIVVVYFKTKNKELVRVASREGHYNENISRPSSGKSNSGLIMNPDPE